MRVVIGKWLCKHNWHRWRTFEGLLTGRLKCTRCSIIEQRHRPLEVPPCPPSSRDFADKDDYKQAWLRWENDMQKRTANLSKL